MPENKSYHEEQLEIYKNFYKFYIRFSNLFMIENKIGEYQTRIMDKFPDSSFTVRRELIFADIGPEFTFEEIKPQETIGGRKIWKLWKFCLTY